MFRTGTIEEYDNASTEKSCQENWAAHRQKDLRQDERRGVGV